MTEQLFSDDLATPVGTLTLVGSDAGLCAVAWPSDGHRVRFGDEPVRRPDHPVISDAKTQLAEYFAGERREFDLALDLRGTDFQIQVWRSLASIPFGQTTTYSEQAGAIGRPSAVRAVGAANGRNPVSIVLPCHRVVGRDGSLTGFAAGLETKRLLLDFEAGRAQLELVGR